MSEDTERPTTAADLIDGAADTHEALRSWHLGPLPEDERQEGEA